MPGQVDRLAGIDAHFGLFRPTTIEAAVPGVTLGALESLAMANNPTLARAAARVDAARGQCWQSGLPSNPIIGYNGTEIGQDGRAGQQGAFVGQQLSLGGKLRLNRSVAEQEVQMAEHQFAAQRWRVATDVRVAFYHTLAAQHKLDIARELLRVSDEASQAVQRFHKADEASRVDLLQARVEANLARNLLDSAQNDYTAAWRRLGAVAGQPEMQPAFVEGDLQSGIPEIAFDDAYARLLASSPELAVAQTNVCRAQQAVLRARAEPRPDVDMQFGLQHDNSTHYDIASVQLGLPIPVLNRNAGGIQRAEAELVAAQSDVRRVELDLRQRLAVSYQKYANARQQVARYRESILPDVKTSLDLVGKGYRQGEFGYLTVLTAQRTYFQTNLAYLDALVQLRESTELIEGLLLTDSLRGEDAAR
jgi:cobalt-zinc-cadmium efflux system outer membrane protein